MNNCGTCGCLLYGDDFTFLNKNGYNYPVCFGCFHEEQAKHWEQETDEHGNVIGCYLDEQASINALNSRCRYNI